MAIKSRTYLKSKFQNEDIPVEQDFVDFIDSAFNRNDDSISSMIGYTPENVTTKNQSNGYAGLDSSGKLFKSLLPTNINPSDVGLSNVTNDMQVKASQLDTDALMVANSDDKVATQKAVKSALDTKQNTIPYTTVPNTRTINGHELSSDIVLDKSDVGLSELTNDAQVKRSEMGLADGVASLDATGKIPVGQLPANLPYDIQIATTTELGGIKIGDNLFIDGEGVLSGNPSPVQIDWDATEGLESILNKPELATDVVDGFMSSTDKAFLDDLSATAKCVAWVNFNGTGTVAINSSYNVTNITDNDVGDYTINFTSNLVDANYVVVGSAIRTGTGSTSIVQLHQTTPMSVSSCRISITSGDTNTNVDCSIVTIAIFR